MFVARKLIFTQAKLYPRIGLDIEKKTFPVKHL